MVPHRIGIDSRVARDTCAGRRTQRTGRRLQGRPHCAVANILPVGTLSMRRHQYETTRPVPQLLQHHFPHYCPALPERLYHLYHPSLLRCGRHAPRPELVAAVIGNRSYGMSIGGRRLFCHFQCIATAAGIEAYFVNETRLLMENIKRISL